MVEEVYASLRAAASRRLDSGQTLEPTELVHEVFLRLQDHSFSGLTHFRAVASMAMRQIIIDRARRRQAAKRGGDQVQVTLSGLGVVGQEDALLDLNRALSQLEARDPRKGRVVELRLFGGMQLAEIAEEIGVSVETVKRDWRTARAWLTATLS